MSTSRYRKIEVRTWSDEGFRNLSPIPPCGQGLLFFLLTGPHTGPIPGLFRAGRGSMADELNWTMEAFDEAFAEVFEQGMAIADFKAKLVWLPNALKHNKPESPNVVKSWRVELDLLPECPLKREAIASLRKSLSELGSSYENAFDEVCPKVSSKPSPKPSRKAMPNQEQEQEQEQHQEQEQEHVNNLSGGVPPPAPPEKSGKAKSTPEKPVTRETWDAYCSAYQNRYGTLPVANASVNGKLAQLVKRLGAEESPLVAAFFVRHNNALYVRRLHDVGTLLADCEALRTQWFTGESMTATKAAQVDRTQSNFDSFAALIDAAAEAA